MERYSAEWWEKLAEIAEEIMFRAERVRDDGNRMSHRLRYAGWEDGEPDSMFLKDFSRLAELAKSICEEENL